MRAMEGGNPRRDTPDVRRGTGPVHAGGGSAVPGPTPTDGATRALPDRTRLAMRQAYGESFDQVRLRVTDYETAALGGTSARAVTYRDTLWIRPHHYPPGPPRHE